MAQPVTYFVRHASKLDISDETYRALLDQHLIAIHFPHEKANPVPKKDSVSTDPADYEGTARQNLKRMHMLAKNGGYVCAYYQFGRRCILGKVKKGSKISLTEGQWKSQPERIAQLKTLELEMHRELTLEQQIAILAGRPRQGTLVRWKAVGSQIQRLVDRLPAEKIATNLSVSQQEVMVAEFLRQNVHDDLPGMQSLLMPVGRTLKDVDIFGLSKSGQKLLVQVTNSHWDSADIKHKVRRLSYYGATGNQLIIVGPGSKSPEYKQDHQMIFVGMQYLMDRFLETEVGQVWWSSVSFS